MESDPTPAGTELRRHLLGLIGLALLSVGVYFSIWPPQHAQSEFLQGSCTKAGLVLLAVWLAFPQLDQVPGWLLASGTLTLIVIAARPQILLVVLRYLVILGPLFALLWILRPKTWSRFRETRAGRVVKQLIGLAAVPDTKRDRPSSRRMDPKP
jgi:hypothetical protein